MPIPALLPPGLTGSQSVTIPPRITIQFATERSLTMPLLEFTQTTHVNATIRLEQATAAQVDQYAAFLRAPADEVVDKALSYVFAKDRDFQDFLKTPEAARVVPSLRIRRSPQNGSAAKPAKANGKSARGAGAARDARGRGR